MRGTFDRSYAAVGQAVTTAATVTQIVAGDLPIVFQLPPFGANSSRPEIGSQSRHHRHDCHCRLYPLVHFPARIGCRLPPSWPELVGFWAECWPAAVTIADHPDSFAVSPSIDPDYRPALGHRRSPGPIRGRHRHRRASSRDYSGHLWPPFGSPTPSSSSSPPTPQIPTSPLTAVSLCRIGL